jgi:CheY-like chemotaxis protein
MMVAQNQSLRIAVADDDQTTHKILATFLVKAGHEAIFAKNGQELVDICHNDPTIDLVITDITMPVMDGWEAAEIIQKERKIPVIFLTSHLPDDEAMAKRFLDTKIIFGIYRSKPISEQSVYDDLLSAQKFTAYRQYSKEWARDQATVETAALLLALKFNLAPEAAKEKLQADAAEKKQRTFDYAKLVIELCRRAAAVPLPDFP